MKEPLINTGSYLLVVSDGKIKEGDWFIDIKNPLNPRQIKTKFLLQDLFNSEKKIITHLPLNNSPILEGVDLLPPLEQEDDVEKLAKEEILYNDAKREWWKQGYNKAKEKYKFTEFDMISAFEYGWNQRHYGIKDEEELREIQKRFIQFLSQPKMPVAFECEVEDKPKSLSGLMNADEYHLYKPKTTTNSQGQTVLVGRYIYE